MSADVTAWAAAGSANAATIARTPHTRAHAGNDNLFRIMLRILTSASGYRRRVTSCLRWCRGPACQTRTDAKRAPCQVQRPGGQSLGLSLLLAVTWMTA